MSLHGLASLYQKQGKYAEALPLYERSLVINEKVLGVEHPVVASNLNDLARLYYVRGDYIQALSLFERAIRIAEKKLGRQHPITRRIRKNYRLCRVEWEQANAYHRQNSNDLAGSEGNGHSISANTDFQTLAQ